jgi:amidase
MKAFFEPMSRRIVERTEPGEVMMRRLLICSFLLANLAPAQSPTLTGRWVVTADFYGTPLIFPLELTQQGDKLTGVFAGDKLEGARSGDSVRFLAKDDEGGTEDVTATLQNGALAGAAVFTSGANPGHPETHHFIAKPVEPRPTGAPRRHEFIPARFHRQFSASLPPVLTVAPGDTIHTTTVDAGGRDEKGDVRVLGGNPQTGPFYVETAVPGDVLTIHLTRLKLNRDWAESDDAIVPRGLDNDLAVKLKDAGKSVRWHLDLARGVATPDKPSGHLKNYTVPLRPMLGCIAVAPNTAQAPPGTGDSGRFGGNMDFNEVTEGATVYLAVNVPGALLYLGDGHAAQGDGELNGNALETSMDVEFTVDVIPHKRISTPRVESATHVMVVGLDGSLDDAFRAATSGMAQWLEQDYKLTPSEIAQVIGSAAEYKVAEVADRNAAIVLKISKDRLRRLQ